MLALFCITYAQVIWAQVAIAIVILLGPVFIAFLLFEPLSFLFWGWFRTLLVYTLYGVVAGAVLRVFMGVGLGYITTYADALMGTGTADAAELWLWAVVLLPLVVSGLLARPQGRRSRRDARLRLRLCRVRVLRPRPAGRRQGRRPGQATGLTPKEIR